LWTLLDSGLVALHYWARLRFRLSRWAGAQVFLQPAAEAGPWLQMAVEEVERSASTQARRRPELSPTDFVQPAGVGS
jgi:hypothetical protein